MNVEDIRPLVGTTVTIGLSVEIVGWQEPDWVVVAINGEVATVPASLVTLP